ncbi:MAG: TOBE domain-containing protein, partial [Rubrivivax sp.]
MNLLSARFVSGDATHALVELEGGARLRCTVDASGGTPGEMLTVGVRPEHLALASAGAAHTSTSGIPPQTVQASVTFVEALGGTTHAYCSHPASPEDLCCELDGRQRVRAGQVLTLSVPPEACYVFDAAGQAWQRPTSVEHADAA